MENYPPQMTNQPFVRVLVQPQPKALRFRYKCEGRYPGALTGVGTNAETKFYPTIKVENYIGKFVVVISCVTKDPAHYPHPHHIVSKDVCKDGVYRHKFDRADMTATFPQLGIQCVKKTEVKDSLELRRSMRIDPFNTKYAHLDRASDIDLNAIRLCFQVFIESSRGSGEFNVPLRPEVTDIIYDRKAMSDLQISKLSHCAAPIMGGIEIILLCDKVSKDDIEVYFYNEDKNGMQSWQEKAEILSVHKQVAVVFKSPDCSKHLGHDGQHEVKVHLRRQKVNELGEGRPIVLFPVVSSAPNGNKRARQGDESSIQMQVEMELMRQQDHMTYGVPRYNGGVANSPVSDMDSPAASPQYVNMQPCQYMPIMKVESPNPYLANDMKDILPCQDEQPGPSNPNAVANVESATNGISSLIIDPNINFINDTNLNNLSELGIPGVVSIADSQGNITLAPDNFSVLNLSESMFTSGASLGQLDQLNSGQLAQFKGES